MMRACRRSSSADASARATSAAGASCAGSSARGSRTPAPTPPRAARLRPATHRRGHAARAGIGAHPAGPVAVRSRVARRASTSSTPRSNWLTLLTMRFHQGQVPATGRQQRPARRRRRSHANRRTRSSYRVVVLVARSSPASGREATRYRCFMRPVYQARTADGLIGLMQARMPSCRSPPTCTGRSMWISTAVHRKSITPQNRRPDTPEP